MYEIDYFIWFNSVFLLNGIKFVDIDVVYIFLNYFMVFVVFYMNVKVFFYFVLLIMLYNNFLVLSWVVFVIGGVSFGDEINFD